MAKAATVAPLFVGWRNSGTVGAFNANGCGFADVHYR
jgi:hypothetical protein